MNASQQTGKISDSQTVRAVIGVRGAANSQPTTAMIGTTVCTSSFPSAAHPARSSVLASAT